MAISAQRKAQLDAILKKKTAQSSTGMTSERKAQLDAIISQQKAETVEKKPGFLQGLVQSVASPFLKTATSAANVLEGAGRLIIGDVKGAGEAATKERDYGYFGQNIRPVGVDEGGEFKSTTGFAKDVIGTGAEIGSYLVPGAGALKGVKSVATGGIRALPRVAADQALLGGASGALGEAGIEAQKEESTLGSILSAGAKGSITGAAVGGALPVAGAAIRGITRGIGKLGSEVLGRTTGTGAANIVETFNNPNVKKFSRRASKEGPEGLMSEALEDARNALSNMTSSNNKAYQEAIGRIKASSQDLSKALSSIRTNVVNDATEGFGIRFADGGKKLNTLDFNASDIVEGTASVQRAFDRMFGEPINSVADMDRLKKSLGRIGKGAPPGSPAQALIYRMKSGISDSLKDNVPGYSKEMSRFSDAIKISDDIEDALSLGDNAKKDTSLRKLMSTMRQNNEFRLEMLKVLEGAGKKDLTGKIAGATGSPLLPRGLVGALSGVVTPTGISLSVINPANIPYLVFWLSITSPRLVTEAVSLLGKFKGKEMPAAVKQQFRNLLIRAANEPSDDGSRTTPQIDRPTQQDQSPR